MKYISRKSTLQTCFRFGQELETIGLEQGNQNKEIMTLCNSKLIWTCFRLLKLDYKLEKQLKYETYMGGQSNLKLE